VILQCLGGWCRSRDDCLHYTAPQLKHIMPVERLCGPVEEPEKQKAGRIANPSLPSCQAPLNPVATVPASRIEIGGFTQVATAHIVRA
jgi:hypothetical protein